MLNVADIAIRQKNYQLFSNLLLQRPNMDMLKNWMDTFFEMPMYFTNESAVDWEQWAYLLKKILNNEEKMIKDFHELFTDPSSSRFVPLIDELASPELAENTLGNLSKYFNISGFSPKDIKCDIHQTNNIYLTHFGFKLAYMSYLTTLETHSSMKVRQQLQQEEIVLIEKYLIPFLKQFKENHKSKLNGTIYFIYLEVIDQFLIWDYQKLFENKLVY